MKIVVIDGSPKNQGATKTLFDTLAINDYEYIPVRDLAIKHCIACDYCKSHYGECVFDDDMKEVYKSLKEADGIIVLTPVYFNGVTSLLKMLIDRTQVFFYAKYHFDKVITDKKPFVMTIATGGAKSYDHQFLGVELALEHFYKNLHATEVFKYYLANTDRVNVADFTQDINDKFESVRNSIF